ncbi:PaaI family thioesterase [Sphingorhabdus sp. M41]|uniref:PaaI family thioesterase n=1 Tax=Sphingorhabdus sp. M41 TaxID=1806885 RepID=UPI0018D42C63|nr:DUF4442 domain-containing protein [Sphingorhabdus sp. M41]
MGRLPATHILAKASLEQAGRGDKSYRQGRPKQGEMEMTTEKERKPKYRVEFVERTGLKTLEQGRGHAHLLMPLAGNENHVGVLYMGAFTVLAEAVAALPGISLLDVERHFPILKDIYVDFHKPAASDVTAEFRLPEEEIARLLADLERKGSAGYIAEFPMHDADGTHVATGRVTVKLLSHGWKK